MRIAIVTFHDANNYGAVLQANALKQYLQSKGCDVSFVKIHKRTPPLIMLKNIIKRALAVFRMSASEKRMVNEYNTVFRSYVMNNFPEIAISNAEELSDRLALYSAVIVGSDQVWNLNMHYVAKDAFDVFFLRPKLPCIKATYAVSFGTSTQKAFQAREFQALLEDFKFISVRDEFSDKIVRQCIQDRFIACDPTLLDHTVIDLIPSERLNRITAQPYILLYCLNRENEADYREIVSHIKKELQLPIVSITSYGHTMWEMGGCDKYIRDATPDEWVYLISKSSFVFTDSFHGTIFSLKNRIAFLSYDHSAERGDRVRDIADRYGFSNRLVCQASKVQKNLLNNCDDLGNTYLSIERHSNASGAWIDGIISASKSERF